MVSALQPCGREEEASLRDRNTTRVNDSLEDSESKGEGIGALESVREEACVGNLGARAGSKRDKRLQNFINDLCSEVEGKG